MKAMNLRFLYLILCILMKISDSKVLQLESLRPEEIALLQYDTRPLYIQSYWRTAYLYNQKYCVLHSHQYVYYSLRHGDTCNIKGNELASPWCKVRAMLQANQEYPQIKLFIYMDSDAVIDKKFYNVSVNEMLSVIQHKLPHWDPEEKPMVFNQDGPCWWCRLIARVGYTMCLNAGTVMWYRHARSEHVLEAWWASALDSYADNPIKRKFRLKWPWEQDRQMAVYHRDARYIQVTSHPDMGVMPEQAGKFHLPGNGCFISHHCANTNSKAMMMRTYSKIGGIWAVEETTEELPVKYLTLEPFASASSSGRARDHS